MNLSLPWNSPSRLGSFCDSKQIKQLKPKHDPQQSPNLFKSTKAESQEAAEEKLEDSTGGSCGSRKAIP